VTVTQVWSEGDPEIGKLDAAAELFFKDAFGAVTDEGSDRGSSHVKPGEQQQKN
jgi:hypothetical protein